MGEIVVWEKKHEGGEAKLIVDREKKLLKSIISGKYDDKCFEEWFIAVQNESKKFKKGELLCVHDTSNSDIRLYSSVQKKIAQEAASFADTNFKKIAYIFPSFMHQKSLETVSDKAVDNKKIFTSVQEGMNWLMG